MSSPKVLVKTETDAKAPPLTPMPEAGWRVIAVVGLLLGAIGWLDVLLLWIPAYFGRTEWEFGTISSTFDALPLATLGLSLILAGAIANGWRVRLRVVAWFAFVVAVVLLAALVLYATDVPLAWSGVQPAAQPVLKRVMIKTVLLAVAYIAAHGMFGFMSLRRLKAAA